MHAATNVKANSSVNRTSKPLRGFVAGYFRR
jgi:hypothetical protein